jgi:hypothetical protein
MMRKAVKTTGVSRGEAEGKARLDLSKKAAKRSKKLTKFKSKGEVVYTKGGAFYFAKSSGRFKKDKG